MPKLPREPLSRKKDSQFFNNLVKAFLDLEGKDEVKGLLKDLLTASERRIISRRLRVAVLLVKGEKYQKIQEKVGVGSNTITQVNNWLKSGADDLKKAAELLISREEEKAESPH